MTLLCLCWCRYLASVRISVFSWVFGFNQLCGYSSYWEFGFNGDGWKKLVCTCWNRDRFSAAPAGPLEKQVFSRYCAQTHPSPPIYIFIHIYSQYCLFSTCLMWSDWDWHHLYHTEVCKWGIMVLGLEYHVQLVIYQVQVGNMVWLVMILVILQSYTSLLNKISQLVNLSYPLHG